MAMTLGRSETKENRQDKINQAGAYPQLHKSQLWAVQAAHKDECMLTNTHTHRRSHQIGTTLAVDQGGHHKADIKAFQPQNLAIHRHKHQQDKNSKNTTVAKPPSIHSTKNR
jgi:hypothetical protein